jgi:threonine/homoserine/homoserine lactone efflux protein
MFTTKFPLTSLVVVLVPGTGVIFTASTSLAHAERGAVIESPRVQTWLRRGFAGVFAGLGVRLALAGR